MAQNNITSTAITTQSNESQVIVTKEGDKYHLSTCGYVKDKKNTFSVPISEAKEKGYEACSVCNPK